ncbi:hypothetical protein EOE18_12665 [Novosphingobium umbonatum]|uniref:Uncharacterized protein n=1 Tax=Novosphingobium umbonatum TaxID=1908524 RepID=A0A3S2X2W4_9SPHN|nr:hypothetical protein [Novosphingobium umbonatum]RVU04329.1 hypothetical protein EOE18_12665 [Novosphingobium umbonatum]
MSSLSISSNAHHSPRADMNQRIASAVTSGSISEEDASAFSTALDSIDASLSDSASSGTGNRLSPSDMKTRVDSLIDEQVSNGTLTEDQASELEALFAQGPGGASGSGSSGSEAASSDASTSTDSTSTIDALEAWGAAGMQGPMGPPPPPPPSDSDGDSDDSVSATSSSSSSTASSSSTSGTSGSTAADEMASLLAALKKLREGLAKNNGTYSVSDSAAATATSQSASTNGLIIDQMA